MYCSPSCRSAYWNAEMGRRKGEPSMPNWLTLEEAADRLGWQIQRLMGEIAEGKIRTKGYHPSGGPSVTKIDPLDLPALVYPKFTSVQGTTG